MLGFEEYNYGHFTRELMREAGQSFPGPEPGSLAPDFTAKDLKGEPIRLSDYRGKKNVVLIFGSATCPMTAGSIQGMNELYREFRGDDVEFLFLYVREAHPGEKIPAHGSMEEKIQAARLLADAENIRMPILVDSLRGSIHRKYSRLPNPAFLIDKSGRVAFRCMWTTQEELEQAITELLEFQQSGAEHAVVGGGQHLSMPVSYPVLHAYRALERGGRQSLGEFREALGFPGRAAVTASRMAEPLLQNPGRVVAIAAIMLAVVAGGLYAGFELRKYRLGVRRNPYRAYERDEVRDTETGTDYGAVGI